MPGHAGSGHAGAGPGHAGPRVARDAPGDTSDGIRAWVASDDHLLMAATAASGFLKSSDVTFMA